MEFTLTSSAFDNGRPIPAEYTGDGEDNSPPLAWQNVPEGAAELALIVEDPDAPRGDFVHWVIFNIPPSLNGLDAGLPTEGHPDQQAPIIQGRNDAGRTGYMGPAPPPGKVHHYHFRLLALSKPSGLQTNADKGDFREATRHITLAEAELVGTYQR